MGEALLQVPITAADFFTTITRRRRLDELGVLVAAGADESVMANLIGEILVHAYIAHTSQGTDYRKYQLFTGYITNVHAPTFHGRLPLDPEDSLIAKVNSSKAVNVIIWTRTIRAGEEFAA